MKNLTSKRANLGKVIGKVERIQVHQTNDLYTPYIVSLVHEGELLTATIACACGVGEIEGMVLTQPEYDLVYKLEIKLGEEE